MLEREHYKGSKEEEGANSITWTVPSLSFTEHLSCQCSATVRRASGSQTAQKAQRHPRWTVISYL